MLRSPWLLFFLWLAPTASADWLISRDGERVETRGPWKVERTLVVFKTANGSLSSMRLADVDLEASARATAEAKMEKPATPLKKGPSARIAQGEEKRKPVMVLTTESVGRAEAAAEEDPRETVAEPDPQSQPEPSPVEVISWRQAESQEIDGLEILGTLRNDSASIVTNTSVRVSLFDHEGELVGRREAFLDAVSIAARATTGFRALFPGVDVFDGEPVFDVRARELVLSTENDRESDQL